MPHSNVNYWQQAIDVSTLCLFSSHCATGDVISSELNSWKIVTNKWQIEIQSDYQATPDGGSSPAPWRPISSLMSSFFSLYNLVSVTNFTTSNVFFVGSFEIFLYIYPTAWYISLHFSPRTCRSWQLKPQHTQLPTKIKRLYAKTHIEVMNIANFQHVYCISVLSRLNHFWYFGINAYTDNLRSYSLSVFTVCTI